VALDRFLQPWLVFLDEVRAAAEQASGRDCRLIRTTAALADGLAESPQETRLRLLLHGGLPAGAHREPVSGGGREVLSFAWPDAKVALEYDGVWHGEIQHVGRDRRRLNRLNDAGWTVVFVTAADMHHPELLARIARLLASRSAGSRSSVGP
jgi:hypothetical protein